MKIRLLFPSAIVASALLSACGKSEPAGTPATGPQEKLKQDLKQVGEDLKAVKDEAATQVGPAWEKAKDETRTLVHDAAQKLANETSPPPTQPATSMPH